MYTHTAISWYLRGSGSRATPPSHARSCGRSSPSYKMASPVGVLPPRMGRANCIHQTTQPSSTRQSLAPIRDHTEWNTRTPYCKTRPQQCNFCSMWWPFYMGVASLSHEGPDGKYFWLCGPDHFWCKLFHPDPLHEGSPRQYRNQSPQR